MVTAHGKAAQAKLLELGVIEGKIAELETRRKALLSDEAVKEASSLISELEQLLKSRGMSRDDLPALMGLNGKGQRSRPARTFKNPHTGETYTGKSVAGSLKAWIAEHGKEVVDRWEIVG